MIRKLLLFTIGIGALSACAPAAAPPQDTAADEAKLKADLPLWFEHYNAGNADGVANQYADDGVLMPPNAAASTGRAAIRAWIATDSANTKSAGLQLRNNGVTGIGVSGDMAWMSGTFSVVDAAGKTVDTGKYLSVHRRTNGNWLYIRDTWNSDTALPPPPPPAPTKAAK
jgi:ketosteroid isomerase-like protein